MEKRIGLDIDGVLARFLESVLRLGKEMGMGNNDGWPQDEESVTEWMFHASFKRVWEKYCLKEEFWRKLKPYEDAYELNFQPAFYVTARPVKSEVTAAWLKEHGFPEAPVHTLAPIGGGKIPSKLPVVLEERGDAYVDDNVDVFKDLNEGGIVCLLRDRGWNRHHETDLRITSLGHVLDMLDKQEKKDG